MCGLLHPASSTAETAAAAQTTLFMERPLPEAPVRRASRHGRFGSQVRMGHVTGPMTRGDTLRQRPASVGPGLHRTRGLHRLAGGVAEGDAPQAERLEARADLGERAYHH